jgi:hypothetical protein
MTPDELKPRLSDMLSGLAGMALNVVGCSLYTAGTFVDARHGPGGWIFRLDRHRERRAPSLDHLGPGIRPRTVVTARVSSPRFQRCPGTMRGVRLSWCAFGIASARDARSWSQDQ